MKKLILMLIFALLLTGCSLSDRAEYNAKVKRYESLIQSILDNDKFQEKSNNFSITASINQESTGYSYDVIVDKAQRAMYNIEVIVVENNEGFNENEMTASFGIFDESRSMIPNQVNPASGFIAGIKLNALTENPVVNLKILVTWKDEGLANSYSEYFEFNLDYNAINSPEDQGESSEKPADETPDEGAESSDN